MQRKGFLISALLVATLGATYPADPAGRWRGALESPVGSLPVQYTLTPSGATLTGTLELELGTFPLTEGAMRGDSVFFVADIQVVKLTHRGLVRADTLYLAVNDGTEDMPIAVLIRPAAQ